MKNLDFLHESLIELIRWTSNRIDGRNLPSTPTFCCTNQISGSLFHFLKDALFFAVESKLNIQLNGCHCGVRSLKKLTGDNFFVLAPTGALRTYLFASILVLFTIRGVSSLAGLRTKF